MILVFIMLPESNNGYAINKEYPEADIVFERIKTSKTAEELRERLCQS